MNTKHLEEIEEKPNESSFLSEYKEGLKSKEKIGSDDVADKTESLMLVDIPPVVSFEKDTN